MQKDIDICSQLQLLLASVLQDKPQPRLAVYAAMGSEVDLHGFITAAYQDGASVYFPVMVRTTVGPDAANGKQMRFTQVMGDEYLQMQPGFIRNPLSVYDVDDVRLRRPLVAVAGDLDMIVVPVLGFDADGYRLGYGGGNYDRLLATCSTPGHLAPTSPVIAGVAYDEQRLPAVPRDEHDMRLPRVISA
jgi:5-formyltetrahydrofolate cyclo-ligase